MMRGNLQLTQLNALSWRCLLFQVKQWEDALDWVFGGLLIRMNDLVMWGARVGKLRTLDWGRTSCLSHLGKIIDFMEGPQPLGLIPLSAGVSNEQSTPKFYHLKLLWRNIRHMGFKRRRENGKAWSAVCPTSCNICFGWENGAGELARSAVFTWVCTGRQFLQKENKN